MNEEVYTVALKSALTEIKKVCPDINSAFILMNDGTIVAGDEQTADPSLEKAASSLQSLVEKAASVGGLDDLVIDGEKGKVYVSCVNGMYSVMALSKHADLSHLRTVTGVILPTILKVLDSITSDTTPPTPLKSAPLVPHAQFRPAPSEIPEPLLEEEEEKIEETVEESVETPEPLEATEEETEVESEIEAEAEDEIDSTRQLTDLPSQQLIVDKFGGFMVRPDTVQLDFEVLQRWSSLLDMKEINEVDIETFRGKTTRCKAKVISDQKLEGRGLIRIPEKTCEALELKRGELVRVKPVVLEE
jgi:predicted regulator of Ras-like GTPase activity (Roadblock/LC7/MglB family)